jgi:hypothetical protein
MARKGKVKEQIGEPWIAVNAAYRGIEALTTGAEYSPCATCVEPFPLDEDYCPVCGGKRKSKGAAGEVF